MTDVRRSSFRSAQAAVTAYAKASGIPMAVIEPGERLQLFSSCSAAS